VCEPTPTRKVGLLVELIEADELIHAQEEDDQVEAHRVDEDGREYFIVRLDDGTSLPGDILDRQLNAWSVVWLTG
jgi:hypothetical protein